MMIFNKARPVQFLSIVAPIKLFNWSNIEPEVDLGVTSGVIGFRIGFSGRDIFSVYLWCWWQGTKIERLNIMSKLWLIV